MGRSRPSCSTKSPPCLSHPSPQHFWQCRHYPPSRSRSRRAYRARTIERHTPPSHRPPNHIRRLRHHQEPSRHTHYKCNYYRLLLRRRHPEHCRLSGNSYCSNRHCHWECRRLRACCCWHPCHHLHILPQSMIGLRCHRYCHPILPHRRPTFVRQALRCSWER